MDEARLKAHVDELSEILKGELDREDIRKMLETKLNNPLVAGERYSVNQAKIEIVKRYGDKVEEIRLFDGLDHVENIVSELQTTDMVVRIQTLNSRDFNRRDGSTGTKYYGILADGTGSMQYLSWLQLEDFNKGDTIIILNARVQKNYNGMLEVVIDNRTLIHRVSPDLLPTVKTSHRSVVQVKIKEITENLKGIGLDARIIKAKAIQTRAGKPMMVGALLDETGAVPYSYFGPDTLVEGDCYNIKGAYARKRNDILQVVFDDTSQITKAEGEAVKYLPNTVPHITVSELSQGMGWARLKARVLGMDSRTVMTKNGEKMLTTGEMGDRTGIIPYSIWGDNIPFKAGDVVDINGATVKARNGLELGIGFDTTAKVIDDPTFPNMDFIRGQGEKRKTIWEILSQKGGNGVLVEGVLLEIKNTSGLIRRCPQCNRPLMQGSCSEHGDVDGILDMRIKGVIDDGTGAFMVLFNRPLVEEILGYDMEAAKKLAFDKGDNAVVLKELNNKALFKPFLLKGNVTINETGGSMLVREIRPFELDMEERMADIYTSLESINVNMDASAGGDYE